MQVLVRQPVQVLVCQPLQVQTQSTILDSRMQEEPCPARK